MWKVLFPVSLRELEFWGWWYVYLWTPLCYLLLFWICSPSPWVLFSGVGVSCWMSPSASYRQVYSVTRLCPDQSFLSLRHRRRVVGQQVNSNSNRFRFSELLSSSTRVWHTELRLQLIHWSTMYRRVERPNLIGVSCRHRFECGMTFPTLCLTSERWMGSNWYIQHGCFPELCFLQFSVVQVRVGLRKQFIINIIFLLCLCCEL